MHTLFTRCSEEKAKKKNYTYVHTDGTVAKSQCIDILTISECTNILIYISSHVNVQILFISSEKQNVFRE